MQAATQRHGIIKPLGHGRSGFGSGIGHLKHMGSSVGAEARHGALNILFRIP
ncbi:MAG: hypothetical protein Alpg2KO_28160 [Alphaproteobacteria bacterium]